MGQVVIRGLSDEALVTMKEVAELNNRSLEAQLRTLIEDEADQRRRMQQAIADIKELRVRLQGRHFSDSTAMIREDRER